MSSSKKPSPGSWEAPDHIHVDSEGFIHRCWHSTKAVLTTWQFWAIQTFSFPLEHFLWTQVEPFSTLAVMLGLL